MLEFDHFQYYWFWVIGTLFLIGVLRVLIATIRFSSKRQQIVNSLIKWDNLTNYRSGYFSNYEMCLWKEACPQFALKSWTLTVLFLLVSKNFKKQIFKLRNYTINANKLRNEYNEGFLEYELNNYELLFDNIEGSSLDIQQRRAAIINEDNTLIIAGAGTGKTKTIMAKISYLFNKYELDSNQLLLISFTNKSCDEMRNRLELLLKESPEVKTFHKLGLDIIKEIEAENHPNIASFSRKQFHQVIQSIFYSLKKSIPYKRLVNKFFIEYLTVYKDPDDFDSANELYQYIKKEQNFSFKMVTETNFEGRKINYREQLKSQEEVYIANFLFFNNVDYVYEAKYEHRTASKSYSQYSPDFYLPKYEIYIEHFAVDKSNNVPNWFKGKGEKSAKDVYVEGMKWKRRIHKKYDTTLVETYSWEQKEGVLLKNLKTKLKELGVVFLPVSEEEKERLIQKALKNEIQSFINLIGTFLTLFKSNNLSYSELNPNQFSSEFLNKRNAVFLKIFKPIYESYQSLLNERKEIDFSDMINRAADVVQTTELIHGYDYILVDEFQDISVGRLNLLNRMIENSPKTKLYCVGDDWQSIYRFTGSDTSLITQFDRVWGKVYKGEHKRATKTQNIETTYRFPPSMIELSSEFIQKNQKQLNKELKSGVREPTDSKKSWSIIEYDSSNDYRDKVKSLLYSINSRYDKCSVLFLGRYNHDRNIIKDKLDLDILYHRSSSSYSIRHNHFKNLEMNYMTIHSAKGLEADVVVLLNLTQGKFGFPSEINDDPVISMVLSDEEEYENAEERRVFYVALTRAKKHTYLMVDKFKPSTFVQEIMGRLQNEDRLRCSKCGGLMVVRNGKHGPFYGCINYPLCKHTEKIS